MHHRTSRRIRPVVAALVAAALAGAACSGGDDSERAAAAGQAASTTSTTSPPETTTTTAAAPSTSSSATATTKTTAKTGVTSRPAATTPPAAPAPGLDLTGKTVVGPAPTDPAALAAMADELVAAETALRDAATPPAEVGRRAVVAQTIYRRISARPEALPAVLERVPAPLRPAVQANTDAGAELRALAGAPRTSLPTEWRIIPPPPAEELERYYKEAESRFGVPWAYLASVHLVESRMGRIRGKSSAGAQGPMQFMQPTWDAYGEGGDINDPHDSIMAAARYLKANGAPGNMDNALYRYNHSQRYVRAVTLYAKEMEADPRTYVAYHHWQVFYITTQGDVLLEEGYGG
ncbi:MAG TPA: transglycosylase SLT domain-containing protein [Acidimicrobiia bacterium]|nr:transglycosylase SLT domain-containing protein [Acidimicrobiia bacterium]